MGYIGARNKQHESDRAQQDQQGRLDVAHNIFLEGRNADVSVGRGILRFEPCRHRANIGARLGQRDPEFQVARRRVGDCRLFRGCFGRKHSGTHNSACVSQKGANWNPAGMIPTTV